ncbi:hypothetical protein [Oceanobacillus sp. FSL W7-1281]|uniref:hypothetical protein n=1 Tax=Oceanobacillus sp. FSL W7-1281 TaxID=2921698 RepID=UPI0030D93144
MAENKEYIFGIADIEIGEGEDKINFDGKDYLQAEGGSLSLTPSYAEITVADFGETVVQRRLTGWEGQVTISAAQEDAKILKLALASTEPITSTDGGEEGAMDARIGSKPQGRRVRVHPRYLPDSVREMDWVIYNAAATEGFERAFDAEQGNIEITLNMMPREGFNASEPGNFFYRGGTDPNADEDNGNDDGGNGDGGEEESPNS